MRVRRSALYLCLSSFIIFAVCKLIGIIDWSWIWVTMPLWFFPAVGLSFFGLMLIMLLLALLINIIFVDVEEKPKEPNEPEKE
jgi:uncharacterized membrane protein